MVRGRENENRREIKVKYRVEFKRDINQLLRKRSKVA